MNTEKTKAWFWSLLNVLIVVLVLNVVFFVMPLLASLRDSFTPTRVIAVSAQGKVIAIPDVAEVSFSVVSQGKDPKVLSEDNNKKMAAVTKFASAQGIADKDMKTTAYDLQPNYQYDRQTGRSTIFGYTLTQTVTVKIHDLSKVPDVVAGLAPLGVNQIGGVNFTFDDQEKYLAMARDDAFAKVKEKAQNMAHGAGTSLGRVVTISESGNTPPPIYYGMQDMLKAGGAVSAPTPAPIQPGSQEITDSVTVTYALR